MICFVCDNFVEHKNGGAELSLEALIKHSPEEIIKVRSRDFTIQKASGARLVVFSNIAELDFPVMRSVSKCLKYVFIENDYKYCCFRNPLKHKALEGVDCDCHKRYFGKEIEDFILGARKVFWKSIAQKEHYHARLPVLSTVPSYVISCNFSHDDIEWFIELGKQKKNGKYLVMKSDSWVKGVEKSVAYCKKNGLRHKVVGDIEYKEFVQEMAKYSGLVFMPEGYDTCPRMVVEAKVMGLDVITNENVQHRDESWFTGDRDAMIRYLLERPIEFWRQIEAI
jgi:hypothetical protein